MANCTLQIRKNPRVRKIRVRDSGAGNGCANFMGAWKNAFFLQEKPMSLKFLVLGGGFGVWGGGECRFYFYGRADFSDKFLGKKFICFQEITHEARNYKNVLLSFHETHLGVRVVTLMMSS